MVDAQAGIVHGRDMTGDRIREKRKERGLTLAELAARCGVQVGTAWRWEHGSAPSAEYLPRLADELDCDLRWLLTGEPS